MTTRGVPRVSVGLPVFNGERHLRQTIDSILAQTCAEIEVIISDNASTDRTEEICRAYVARDPRVRYCCNRQNLGAAPNFNRVFQLSSADYFKWAPHDDLIAPEFLSRCVEVLDRDRSVVVCFSRVKIIDDAGNVVVDYDPGPDTSSPVPSERFRNLILHPEYAVQQMGVIRAEVLRCTGLHGSYPSSDEVLLAELALAGRFHEIPDRLYFYRRHPQQLTRRLSQRSRTTIIDTSLQGRIVLPKWRYLGGCVKIVKRSRLPPSDKLRCYRQVLRWVLVAPHFRAMAKDLLLALMQMIVRSRRKMSSS